MPSKPLSPEILAEFTSVMRRPAALKRLGVRMTREERKAVEGYHHLEDSYVKEAQKAFQSAGSVSGEALVAFFEGRYERAANRVLKGLHQELDGTAPMDDMALSFWILKRSREHLPGEGISGRELERQQRAMDEADEWLAAMRTEDWNVVREHVREMAETYPAAFRGLVEVRTNRAFSQRMWAAAYRLVLEAGDFHRAGLIVRLADESKVDPSPFPTVGVCPHCLPGYLDADKESRGDPWWLIKRVASEIREIDPEGVKGREEALLMAVSAVHVGQYLRRTDRGGSESSFTLAGPLLERLPSLPCTRKSSFRIPAEDLEGITEVYLGLVALGKVDYEGARTHWRKAEGLGSPIWSEEAEVQREALEEHEQQSRRDAEGHALEEGIQAARKAGDEARELEGLERLESLGQEPDDEQQRRRTFLRVVLARSGNPEDLAMALRISPGDSRVAAAAWAEAKELSGKGQTADAVRLLGKVGSPEDWTPEQLQDYADWAEQAGWTRAKAQALTVLARREASHMVQAVEALAAVGDQGTATALILEDVSSNRPDPVHRRAVYEAALKTRSAEAMEAAARAYVEAAPGLPETEEAARFVRVQMGERAKAEARAACTSAARLAETRDWTGVEGLLKGVPHEFMDDGTVGLLGRALEALSRPQEAARVYGERTGHTVDAARCWLRAGSMGTALQVLQNLSREAEGRPPWLAGILAGKDENLTALAFFALGETREALRFATDPGILERIAFLAMEEGDEGLEMVALGRLHTMARLPPTGMDRLATLRDRAPLGRKTSAGPPLPGERRMVLCDTNVLIDLLVREGEAPGLHGNAEVARRWETLHGAGNLMVVPPTVRAEFLARVSDPGDVEVPDEVMEGVLERAEKLVEDMAPGRVLRVEVRPTRECRRRAEEFFSHHSGHLARLTEEKIRVQPSHEEKIRRKRTGVISGERGGALPELGDIWLLASALRLLETAVPGVGSVAIFSDDRDFRDLRGALQEAFGVDVL